MTDSAAYYGQQPLISSEELAWQGVRVEQFQLEPVSLPATYHAQHLLLLYEVDTPLLVKEKHGSQVLDHQFRTGDLGLYSAGECSTLDWPTPTNNIHLFVDEPYLEQVARRSLDLQYFKLQEQFQFDDPLLAQLGRQLLAVAGSQHALGLLYVESLTNALFYQLIGHHATYERRIATSGRPLTAAVLARIDAYLEAHADGPTTLETLAGLANLSVFHFARLFKQATGTSPYQYVLGWKIKRAQQLLRAGDLPVEVISDTLGFASPTNFSAAFKRAVGRSPREFQRR